MKKVIFLLITLFVFLGLAKAVEATTIFSPILEMEVEPGQKQSGLVKVYNETNQDLYLTASIESFVAGNESGQPIYIPLDQQKSFLSWFTLAQKEITLKPRQVALIPFTVLVPAEAVPGGYYAVIFWQTAPSQKGQVGIASKVGTLAFLKVKGEVVEQGELLEFKTKPDRNYFFSLPVNFLIRFENLGNVHLKPTGEIKLTNWLGQTKILAVNNQQRNVLPHSIRQFEIIWGQSSGNWFGRFLPTLEEEIKNFTLGKYQATLTLNYGLDKPQTITSQLDFWFIPYHLIIALGAVIFIFIILFRVNKKVKKIKQSETKKQ